MAYKTKINKNVAQLRTNNKISDRVAQLSDQLDEKSNYVITYKFYKDDLCELDSLEKNRPKECLKILKRIGQTMLGKLHENNIDRLRIDNLGEYKKLFNKLTPDTKIFEHKVQGTSRIFYFTRDYEFHIVAITNKHFETCKIRH